MKETGEAREVAVETAAALLSTGAGAMISGPGGGYVGAALSPALASGLNKAIDGVASMRRRRGGEAFAEAAFLSELGEEGLANAIAQDERLADLAGRVLLIVQDSAMQEKRLALARVLARTAVAQDEAVLDRNLLVTEALRAIDSWHVRLLSALEKAPGLPDRPVDGQRYGLSVAELQTADPGLGDAVSMLVRQLVAVGLVEDATNGRSFMDRYNVYALTAIARDVLALLRLPADICLNRRGPST